MAQATFEERIARYQRPGDGGYLEAHWDSYRTMRLREMAGLVLAVAEAGPKPAPGARRSLRVLEYGCSSGALFRALEHYLGQRLELSFTGIDADRRALGFLKAKLPAVTLREADPIRLAELAREGQPAADVAIVMLTFYAMGAEETARVIEALGRLAPRIIIGDQIENFAGPTAKVMALKDVSGRPYDAQCHAFRTLLGKAGYAYSLALPSAEPFKSISGYVIGAREPLPGQDRLAHGLAAARGEAFGRAGGAPGVEPFGPILSSYLKTHKLACIDVGAAGGVHDLWRPFGAHIAVDAFEPNADACRAAQAASPPYVTWHAVALGPRSGTQPFYVLNAPSGSSFYPPDAEVQKYFNDARYHGIAQVLDIETMSLDDFLCNFKRPKPNLIKLDTQGSELDILKSLAGNNWEDLVSIEVEVEFLPLYKDQPLFGEVDAFLKSKGFLLFDLRTAREYCSAHNETAYYLRRHLNYGIASNRLSARLYAGDALYVRDFLAHRPRTRDAVFRLVATLVIYSYFDYALHACDCAREDGVIDEDERTALFEEIKAMAPRPEPWQRADAVGAAALAARLAQGHDDTTYRAFWMTRSWPNQ